MFLQDLLQKAFIAPFQSKMRRSMYIAAILGCFSFSGLMFFYGFDYLDKGPWAVAIYFMAKTVSGMMLMMPFLFFLFQKMKKKSFFTLLFILQTLCILFLILIPYDQALPEASAFINGILFTIISAPFWALFHIMMIQSSSDENLGNEISVALIGINIGNLLGSVSGGLALAFLPGYLYMLFCFAAFVVATTLLAKTIPEEGKRIEQKTMLESITLKPWRTINTMLDGSFHFLGSFFLPVWLGFIGIGSVMTGFLAGANILSRLIISPFAGHLSLGSKAMESKIGAILKTIGWGPWLFTLSPFNLIWSYLFWNTGQHLYAVGLQSRWYKEKTYNNMAAREFLLGVGRGIACVIAVPALYTAPVLFFAVSALFGVLTVLASYMEAQRL